MRSIGDSFTLASCSTCSRERGRVPESPHFEP